MSLWGRGGYGSHMIQSVWDCGTTPSVCYHMLGYNSWRWNLVLLDPAQKYNSLFDWQCCGNHMGWMAWCLCPKTQLGNKCQISVLSDSA
jgi:hypothetical protein